MKEENKNEIILNTIKLNVTDEIKKMSLEQLEKYGFSSSMINSLNNLGIKTVGELLAVDTDKLYDDLEEDSYSYCPYWSVRHALMNMGLLFNDDKIFFEANGISAEVALVPIKTLKLSSRVKNAIVRGSIDFLGDLLTTDFDEILKIRNMGNDGMVELKKFAHSLGYSLKNERKTIKEITDDCKEKGKLMVQEVLNLDSYTIGILYRNNIYTIDDLLNFGKSVFDLVGMSPVKQKKLIDEMKEKDLHFKSSDIIPSLTPISIKPTNEVVKRLKEENESIKNRIEEKERLMKEYESLISERKSLIEREKKLDEEIAKKVAMLQSGEVKEEGISYGRR